MEVKEIETIEKVTPIWFGAWIGTLLPVTPVSLSSSLLATITKPLGGSLVYWVWADEGESDDWQCVQTLGELNNGHTSTVWALSFNAGGDRMVICSDDLTLKVWETENMQSGGEFAPWKHLCTLTSYHDRTIFSVHWSREGILASGAADDAICLFVDNNENEVGGPLFRLLLKEKAHDMDINCVQWSPGEKPLLISASDDGPSRYGSWHHSADTSFAQIYTGGA